MNNSSVTNISNEELSSIIKSNSLTLVDFWAPWCAPCIALAPILEDIASLYINKVQVCKLDIDDNAQATKKYGIKTIPTIILFKKGEIIDHLVGIKSKEELITTLDKHLS